MGLLLHQRCRRGGQGCWCGGCQCNFYCRKVTSRCVQQGWKSAGKETYRVECCERPVGWCSYETNGSTGRGRSATYTQHGARDSSKYLKHLLLFPLLVPATISAVDVLINHLNQGCVRACGMYVVVLVVWGGALHSSKMQLIGICINQPIHFHSSSQFPFHHRRHQGRTMASSSGFDVAQQLSELGHPNHRIKELVDKSAAILVSVQSRTEN